MSSETKLFGLIKLETPLLCSEDALGKSIDFTLGGYSSVLSTPLLPNIDQSDPLKNSLIPPDISSSWKRGDKSIYWGSLRSYPVIEAAVSHLLLEFIVPVDSTDTAGEIIYSEFESWVELFQMYVTLISTQHTRTYVSKNDSYGSLELLVADNDNLRYIARTQVEPITIYSHDVDERLDLSMLSNAVELSLTGNKPKLEYLLLLQAFQARNLEDYRKAVIEAANAVEVSLTSRILKEFDEQGISYGDKLLKRFRMLSGRFELARIIGIELPDKDYKNLIIEPRNNVIHRADEPDISIAEQVVNETDELIKILSTSYY